MNSQTDLIISLRNLSKNTNLAFSQQDRLDILEAAYHLENPPKPRFRIPWWSFLYFIGTGLFSIAYYITDGLFWGLMAEAISILVTVVSYGLYRWIRWVNEWD